MSVGGMGIGILNSSTTRMVAALGAAMGSTQARGSARSASGAWAVVQIRDQKWDSHFARQLCHFCEQCAQLMPGGPTVLELLGCT
jgi:hypothetical protein